MENETRYVFFAVTGFIALCIVTYLVRRKKDSSDTKSFKTYIDIEKRFKHNKVLLIGIGIYRLLEITFLGNLNDSTIYHGLSVVGGVLAVPFFIVWLLALISSVAGIIISLVHLRKDAKAPKLLLVSALLFVVTFLWNYLF